MNSFVEGVKRFAKILLLGTILLVVSLIYRVFADKDQKKTSENLWGFKEVLADVGPSPSPSPSPSPDPSPAPSPSPDS